MGLPDVFLGKYVGNYHPRNAACPDPILSAFRVEKTLKKKSLQNAIGKK